MTEVMHAPAHRARPGVAVWGARLFLALVFLYVGAIKLPSEAGMWVRLFDTIGFGQWFRYVTAVVEMLGGVMMLFPSVTPAAVLLTASAMVGALIVHGTVTGFGPQTVTVTVLLALTAFVGWSHMRRAEAGHERS